MFALDAMNTFVIYVLWPDLTKYFDGNQEKEDYIQTAVIQHLFQLPKIKLKPRNINRRFLLLSIRSQ